MSEVEKIYENAGIQKQYCGWLNIGDLDTNVQYVRCATKEKYDNYAALDSSDLVQIIPDEVYPPFTAEKQLELIKWLAKFNVRIEYTNAKYFIESHRHGYSVYIKYFEQALAKFINILWQDLTEEEKQEIKRILE